MPVKYRNSVTQEQVKALFNYDPETGIFTRKVNHFRAKAGTVAGRVSTRGYIHVTMKGTFFYGHRLAWLVVYGNLPEHQIDHINGDRTDNRIRNLRAATNGENQANAALQKNSTSKHKGVSWVGKINRWCGYVYKHKKKVFNRYFVTKEEAIAAVRNARTHFHGEFAKHE
jgi:hypothetical protein